MASVPDSSFRCPTELLRSATPLDRVLIIGSCLVAGWKSVIEASSARSECDFFLLNNAAQLPEEPPHPIEDYSFQIVQIPLRTVMPEAVYFRPSYDDQGVYEEAFEQACTRMSQFLTQSMQWNRSHGILTFVANFLVPQQNPLGRLLPRYDLRNLVYFVSKLNEALDEELRSYRNAVLLDLDQIACTYGRRHVQDDVMCVSGHGATLSDWDFAYDRERIDKISPASNYYPLNEQFISCVWNEIVADFRTIRQVDMVKLVVVDIDDTLWRGVGAEKSEIAPTDVEGWPLGVVEALAHLKRRGVLLALVSKNTEERVVSLWNRVFRNRLELDDFAVRKINWRSKPENIEEVLAEVNLLPRNVLFLDDNPRERADVLGAFPEIRVLGSNPYLWRRILLWSSETQVALITNESSDRTKMVRAQVERENIRRKMSREEFLATLGTQVTIGTIRTIDDRNFARAIELINKSNQFNTTGERLTATDCQLSFSQGGRFIIFQVSDKFTAYGIVGVVVTVGSCVRQFVMSCRVVGLDVEVAVMAYIMKTLGEEGFESVEGRFSITDANLLCRDLFRRCGFEEAGDIWRWPLKPPLPVPDHIELIVAESNG